MVFEKYIENTLPDNERSPEQTVKEFIEVYNKWARVCHNTVKTDRNKLIEMSQKDSETRDVLKKIYKKYCTSKNRQYQRASGYFFYGGSYNTGSEIESYNELSKNTIEIITKKVKNISNSKKYIVVKQATIWKIDSVQYLGGDNQWMSDIL